ISLDQARKAAFNGETRPMRGFASIAKPAQQFVHNARPDKFGNSKEIAHRQTFLPLSNEGETLATRQSEQHNQAVARGWMLTGNYPIVAAGFSVQPPPYWRSDHKSEDLTVLHCRHKGSAHDSANPKLGLKYEINATLIPRASGYRPDFPNSVLRSANATPNNWIIPRPARRHRAWCPLPTPTRTNPPAGTSRCSIKAPP
ncbi:MAG: hypothetical protein P8X79_21595, partial [Reinekea sp.]